jgi:hypothetical protein
MEFDGGLGGEAEETAQFLPVIRQVLLSGNPLKVRVVGSFE